MTTQELQSLMDSGEFHHATYRNIGTLWEGLWIYRKAEGMARGFDIAGSFLKDDASLDAAHEMTRHTGVSVGSYGNG